jgi:hypothetical protein
MTAFDHLEGELLAGVRRVHGSPRPGRAWRRPTMVALASILAAAAAAALAATGTIRIGHTHQGVPGLKPEPHVSSGVRAGAAQTLALRVADPAGGPPWTLRVFGSSRGGHCVQVGQVVRGRFGVFVPPGILEPLSALPGADSSLCSGLARNGFPVVRGLRRLVIIGGSGDPRRCPGQRRGDCSITSATLLRYGLLGPGARRVRLIDAYGRTLGAARTSALIGGAYLFALSLPVAPYAAADRSPSHAKVPQLPDVGVIATFASGQTLRVAGQHRSPGPLPGLGSRRRGYAPPATAADPRLGTSRTPGQVRGGDRQLCRARRDPAL